MKQTLRVCVSGAAGQIAYSALFRIAAGDMLGTDQPLHLILLDTPHNIEKLEGVAMELVDCAFPLLEGYTLTADPQEAFVNVDYCMLFGAFPRQADMQRSDLLSRNKDIFVVQGKAIEEHAKPTCRILVIGNPANTNALILSKQIKKIPRTNITSMSRLDTNRARGQVAMKLGVRSEFVHNVWVAGNHSNTMVPIINHGYAERNGKREDLCKILEDAWVTGDFKPCVRGRGTAVIKARGHSSSASAAAAAIDHVRDWHFGTAPGHYTSASIYIEDGNPYGIGSGIFYSMPCTCKDGKWEIVKLDLPADVITEMKASEEELRNEAQLALQ